MKKFLKKIFDFLLPVIVIIILLNLCLPINYWTFRNWEAMAIFKMPASVGYFYKNQHAQMIEIGEFAPNTPYGVPKKCSWQTDDLGFRNSTTSKGMEILFIGDSYVTGTSLDQTETLSSLTQLISGKKTYQIAPATFDDFKRMLELNLLRKPKTIVFTVCERQLPGLKPVAAGEHPLSDRDIIKGIKKVTSGNDEISTLLTYFDVYLKMQLSGQ